MGFLCFFSKKKKDQPMIKNKLPIKTIQFFLLFFFPFDQERAKRSEKKREKTNKNKEETIKNKL